MGSIRVLDDHLVNRIAAGEVVERPASVVKELLENSLDAGARTVRLEVEAGGARRIRVTDDGRGMDRDDALLAFERHATSKLRETSDLDAIGTLGFRGEALPSIASVSRMVLRTAAADGAGTEVEIHGGCIRTVREVGLPVGTSIEVARLFFNTPARRKFLRSESTELAHVARVVVRYALARPDVRFSLRHGERELLDVPGAEDSADRARRVLGVRGHGELIPFDLERGGVRVHGLAGRPSSAAPRRDRQHVFVNGRAVQDRVLSHAITDAYANTLARGLYAPAVVFVEIPPDGVDVNVHPQKAEVRFRQSSVVHDVVRDAVRTAFARPGVVPSYDALRPARPTEGPTPDVAERPRPFDFGPDRPAGGSAIAWSGPDPAGSPGTRRPGAGSLDRAVSSSRPAPSSFPRSGAPRARAQVHRSYIVAEDSDGLVLVDQHAAHERILFERFLDAAENDRVERQRLAFPVVVELSVAERLVFDREREAFHRLGFEIEPFGENTVRIDAVPALTSASGAETVFRELLGTAERSRSVKADAEEARYRLVTTAACKAAIKIRHDLTIPEMQRLLDDLYATESPSTCPHGRPLVFRLSVEEIERAFRRR